MHLYTIGLNHQTAPIEIRERAAFSPDSIEDALRDLKQTESVREAAILSTCNRTEIYCGHESNEPKSVMEWLKCHTGLQSREMNNVIYNFPDEQAVRHVFRVASGLDSMVMGESQILGQMKSAFQSAVRYGTTGKVINRLFQHAFHVAKQVRTDTTIGENAVSVANMGVNLAKQLYSDLSDQRVLLIGAGDTIELVARYFKQNLVKHIVIANRSIARAEVIAQEIGTEAIRLSQVPSRLSEADIVVSSTASMLPILGKGAIENALKERRRRPMFLLDLAVPRDIEPEVSQLQDAYLYTIDDLENLVKANRGLRQQAAEQAENIIDLQVVKFMRWKRSLQSVPVICSLREDLDKMMIEELAKAKRKLRAGTDPNEILEQMARDLTNKFAHKPSQTLRHLEEEGDHITAGYAKRLFKL
ncbi:MAG: glutamyl-tRNA reductase [Gammaproteobacteria bacterium]|nr:glutamyl-tRNA reductase [Gammaproteobacteria bacterium]MCY4218807.1 glutamyl-tRNA reductase [Gammaproteobacteria bacterium]MCY4274990.1 glutamyl-tRNA reductase [Gammaproteobacteria bacterium]